MATTVNIPGGRASYPRIIIAIRIIEIVLSFGHLGAHGTGKSRRINGLPP
jgi:hypothetical protein